MSEGLETDDPAGADDEAAQPPARERTLPQLETAIIALATDLAAAEARWLGLVGEFDERQGWAVHGVVSCAHWLSWRCGLSLHAAREKVRVARALTALPKVFASFEKGELSYARARAITRVATPDNEEALVETARHSTGAQLERVCRGMKVAQTAEERSFTKTSQRSVSYFWDDDGMLILRARLEADEGAAVIAALDAAQAADWNDRATRATQAPSAAGGAESEGGDGAVEDPYVEDDAPARDDVEEDAREEDAVGGHLDGGDPTASQSIAVAPFTEDVAEAAPVTEDVADVLVADVVVADAVDDAEQEFAVGRKFTRADALVAVAETYLAHQHRSAAGADVYQVVVHLQDGEHARLEDGPGLDRPTALRLICDATLFCVHRDADGNVMDIGRTTRKIPTALRKALWVRDGCCRFPGCGRRRRVDGHHIQHWSDGGPTALHNLVLLCRRHHRAIHREEFSVVMFPDGQPRFFSADGADMPEVPQMPATAGDTRRWHAGLVDRAAVDTRWRGEQLDLDYVASVLAQRRPNGGPTDGDGATDGDDGGPPTGSEGSIGAA